MNRGSLARIWVLAAHTFTQLARMKVFYFLAAFALIVVGSNFFNLLQHELPETYGFAVLRAIKSWSLGAMTLFSLVLAVVATALLLPRDMEDRTLYTVLAKPVRRFDYLAGKLLGMLLLLGVSLAVMDLMMVGVLQLRIGAFAANIDALETAGRFGPEEIARMRANLAAHQPDAALHGAVAAVWLRAAVLTALTLFLSTFASGTLFTSITGFLVFFIGHLQADLREVLFGGGGWLERGAALVVTLLVPDFQMFNVIDGVIEGGGLPWAAFGRLLALSAGHLAVYLAAAWFVFAGKEV